MRAGQLDAYAPALLGLMSVCGVASNKAPGLLRSRLQAMSRLPQMGRAELFRAVLRACRRSLAHAPGR